MKHWLIFGGNGWIGTQLVQFLAENSMHVTIAKSRGDDPTSVSLEIKQTDPDVVFCCLGRTHGQSYTTIDYLEQPGKLLENIRDNLFAPLVLAEACRLHQKYMVYVGTGCIFDGLLLDEQFTEAHQPNFFGSSYSIVKGFTDRILKFDNYRHVLNLRIRMPISDQPGPRNFITKITNYDKVINVQNSMTVLPSMFPHLLNLVNQRVTGTLNFTNPGSISHNQVLDMYREIVNPGFQYKNFSITEQNNTLDSKRSNNVLDTTKLQLYCPTLTPIDVAIRECLMRYKNMCVHVPNTVLITGGCGFIGSHMVKYLFDHYPLYKIVNVDVLTYSGNIYNVPAHIRASQRYKFVKQNITDVDEMITILKNDNIDTVLHFAAETHVDKSFCSSLQFTETNVLGTHVLLQATLLCKDQIKRFIHVSTDEVYGDVNYQHKVLESNRLNPTNPYAASKVGAEYIINSYKYSFNLPIIITRCNNVFGPCQYPEKVIPKFILQSINGLPITIHGRGHAKRCFMYVDDVVKAFDLILHYGLCGEIYNIGVHEELSVLDLATKIRVAMSQRGFKLLPIEFVEDRLYNDQRYNINYDKLVKLGWSPQWTFDKGMKETVDWYIQNCDKWDYQKLEL